MRRRPSPTLLAAVGICAAVSALGQPRPATAALVSYLAIATLAGRRFALLACLAVAVGLIVASPPHKPDQPATAVERR